MKFKFIELKKFNLKQRGFIDLPLFLPLSLFLIHVSVNIIKFEYLYFKCNFEVKCCDTKNKLRRPTFGTCTIGSPPLTYTVKYFQALKFFKDVPITQRF